MRLAISFALALALAGCNEFQIVSSCTDSLQNGEESDADCGGDTCPRCALGRKCKVQSDCFSGECLAGICTPPKAGVWAEIKPASRPAPRYLPAVTFDSTTTLLFGGRDGAQVFDDTWRWDGSNWTNASPKTTPPGRVAPALVFDVGQERVVMFSGGDSIYAPIDDTWTFSNNDWTKAPVANGPSPRLFSTVTYDMNDGQIVLFGGIAGGAYLGDTWARTDGTWQAKATPGPPSRYAAMMTYDTGAKQVVLFGGAIGVAAPIADVNDTWTWNGATWTNAAPATSPTPRYGAAMAYDSVRKRAILFGGIHAGAALDDTWEWDGHAWSKIAGTGPSARHDAAMSYDPTRGRAVLFGGSPDGTTFLDDTWEYHQIANPCKTSADCDTGHCVDGLCCEVAQCGMCEACNLPMSPGRCASCGTACDGAGVCQR